MLFCLPFITVDTGFYLWSIKVSNKFQKVDKFKYTLYLFNSISGT